MEKGISIIIDTRLVPVVFLLILPFLVGPATHQALGQENVNETTSSLSGLPTQIAGCECTAGTWSVKAPYPLMLESPNVASNGTFVYAAGGFIGISGMVTNTANRYDPTTDTWTALPNMPTAVFATRGVYAANTNAFYVFGGYTGSVTVTTVQKFDIASGTWTTVAPLPASRYFPNVAYYAATGKIYVIGGFDGTTFTEASQTWEYDPVANTWNTSRANIPVPMGGAGTSISGQFIYLVGNWNDGTGSMNHYRYDITNNAWTTKAPPPVALYEPAAMSVNNKNYVVGGGNPGSSPDAGNAAVPGMGATRAPETSYSTTYIYDIASNMWSIGPSTNVAHSFTAGASTGGGLYVLAGLNGTADTNTFESLTVSGPTVAGAVSRKTHGGAGNFDISMPLTGSSGVECRTTGGTNDYTLVVTFSGNVTVTGTPQAQVTSGTGCVGSSGTCTGNVSVSGAVVTVPLTNIANAQVINVRINGVNSASDQPAVDVNIPMGILWGDANGNRAVNAADVSLTKSRSGQVVGGTNFRSDVNANGSINAGDAALCKQYSGTSLPP